MDMILISSVGGTDCLSGGHNVPVKPTQHIPLSLSLTLSPTHLQEVARCQICVVGQCV